MNILEQKLGGANTVAILGHIRPDGDCIGSCLGLYNYIRKYDPQIEVKVYIEEKPGRFQYLKGFSDIIEEHFDEVKMDLCITLDCSDRERLGARAVILDQAKDSFCVDHHITNCGFTKDMVLEAQASSTCEVLYGLLQPDKIDRDIAECLYTGIIHDTGVFKYSNTSKKTMQIAGELMEKGIDFGKIIDEGFYQKTYVQNQILGRALLESVTFHSGKCVFSSISREVMDFYGVTSQDMEGVVDQLRNTKGIEVAIFMYEIGPQCYKVSMRSNKFVDVSAIAFQFGGGGHIHAAGCSFNGSTHDIINNISALIDKQFEAYQDDQRNH